MRVAAVLAGWFSVALAVMVPASPSLSSKAHLVLAHESSKVIAAENENMPLPPASLAKLMSMYVVDKAIKAGQISLEDEVKISERAWRTGGSRMFIEVGSHVKVIDLIQGAIVQSGNDAVVALAEHVAGSTESFVDLMNNHARRLGMDDTYFVNPTGWPDPEQLTTAKDLARLAQVIVDEMSPELYQYYSQKWFTYNGIKQNNRNRLLWRDGDIDGLKTGHTDEGGYNLVATGMKNGSRLISVVLGAADDATRADESYRLLTYGFRFYETHQLFAANEVVEDMRVWMGNQSTVAAGSIEPINVTIPTGTYHQLSANARSIPNIKAPIIAGDVIGTLTLSIGDKIVKETPLVALQDIPQGNIFSRAKDYVSLRLKAMSSTNDESTTS